MSFRQVRESVPTCEREYPKPEHYLHSKAHSRTACTSQRPRQPVEAIHRSVSRVRHRKGVCVNIYPEGALRELTLTGLSHRSIRPLRNGLQVIFYFCLAMTSSLTRHTLTDHSDGPVPTPTPCWSSFCLAVLRFSIRAVLLLAVSSETSLCVHNFLQSRPADEF